MFIAALFTIVSTIHNIPSYGNSQDAPQLTKGSRKCGIYIQWNFIQPQRRMKFYHLQVSEWS
jgi:hypothetical protein